MKKQTLLGAVALTTIAVAGQAGAGVLTVADVNGASVKATAVLAKDYDIKGAALSGTVGLNWAPSAGAILPAGNAMLTVNLIGGATFGTAVTPGAVVTKGTCAPTTTISEGGSATSKSVTFLVSNLQGCKNEVANNLQFKLPLKLDGSNTAVNVEAGLKTELGNAIDGGLASTYDADTKTDLISFKNAITVTPNADDVATYASLKSKFKELATTGADDVIGTVSIKVDALSKGINDVAVKTAATDVTSAVFTVKGDVSTIKLVTGGATYAETTEGSGTSKATVNAPAGADNGTAKVHTISLTELATDPVIKASTYSVSVDLTAADYKAASLSIGATQLQSLTREGAAYLLPWVASGTLSTTSTSNTVVRLANIGTEATGPVSIELLTSSTGTAPSTTLVPVAASIAKGGELVLTSGDFEAKLGANFGRGDIRITVEGQPESLIVRRFVQSTTTGALSEVSLGRTANPTTGSNYSNSEPVN